MYANNHKVWLLQLQLTLHKTIRLQDLRRVMARESRRACMCVLLSEAICNRVTDSLLLLFLFHSVFSAPRFSFLWRILWCIIQSRESNLRLKIFACYPQKERREPSGGERTQVKEANKQWRFNLALCKCLENTRGGKEKGIVVAAAMLPHNDNQWISISGLLSLLVGYGVLTRLSLRLLITYQLVLDFLYIITG
jgi:hypothetical protein